MAFLHGVETIRVQQGSIPIDTVPTASAYIVGSANLSWVDQVDQTVNENKWLLSPRDARKFFGPVFPETTLGYSCEIYFNQATGNRGSGTIIGHNVLDPATHTASVSAVTGTVTDGEVDLSGFTGIDYILENDSYGLANFDNGFDTLVVEDSGQATTYTEGTDYQFDQINQRLVILSGGGISEGDDLSISYDYLDPSALTTSEIIGSITGTDQRTGLKGAESVYQQLGFFPKMILAPEWSDNRPVYEEMISQANTARGYALADYPTGVSFQDAIASRGNSGPQDFNVSSYALKLHYPWMYARDGKGGEILRPLSVFAAGAKARNDRAIGFWASASNTELRGAIRPEFKLTSRINDPDSQVNQLNANGITTVFRSFGTGNRLWGNRSTAFPRFNGARTFAVVEFAASVIYESQEYAMLFFIDNPLSTSLIKDIIETSNDYMRSLINRGALVDGRTYLDEADNPPEQLANGQLVLTNEILPPAPLERITFRSTLNTDLASTLTEGLQRVTSQ